MRYAKELDAAKALALEAAQMLCEELHRDGGPRGYRDKADVDNEVEILTRDLLEKAFPSYGIVGEEYPERDRGAQDAEEHIWFIDPNDGTWGFMKGWRGSAFSLGLMRNGIPVLGVVMAHAYPLDGGKLFAWAEGMPSIEVDGTPCKRIDDRPLSDKDILLVSQSGDNKPGLNSQLSAPARFMPMPSIAHRLALAAAGEFAVATSLNSPDTLDCLAGHALLIGAGGEMYDSDGEIITYASNGRMSSRIGVFGGRKSATKEVSTRQWERVLRKPKEARNPRIWLTHPSTGLREPDSGVYERGLGSILGALCGDAFGSQVEFMSAEEIAKAYPQGLREIQASPVWHTMAGQPTDDGELMLMLARALLASEDLADFSAAENYLHWYRSMPFDIGNTISAALSALSRGPKAHEVKCRGPQLQASQANGALMRAMPIGVFGAHRSDQEIAQLAREDALLTHPNPACGDANELYCLAIARLVQGGPSPQELHSELLKRAKDQGFDAVVIQALQDAMGQKAPKLDGKSKGWLVLALQNAFFELLRVEHIGFEEAMIATVSRGGDTDTNAAIAGGLFGAYCGSSEIPERWQLPVLTARPIAGQTRSKHPRPAEFWPVDVEHVTEKLLWLARQLP